MQNGGNAKFAEFMDSYGPDGGYTKGMGINDKYNTWAASQYRDKLAAECAEPPVAWSPSPPPADAPTRPQSSQATRKARGSQVPSRTGTPASSGGRDSPASGQGSGNEAFFERLGNANASRPDGLPPSQGGKYVGFGSAPEPEESSQHPSYGLSSRSAPTLDEFQRNPLGALSKGWGLFSSAVATAGREINESVVKPGMSRAHEAYESGTGDEFKRYLGTAAEQARAASQWTAQRAGEGWEQLNDVARQKAGVDLNERLGSLGLGGRTASGQGYSTVGEASGNYSDDFFDEFQDGHDAPLAGSTGQTNAQAKKQAKEEKKKDNWEDDDWKDF